jgi:hypothetical protein
LIIITIGPLPSTRNAKTATPPSSAKIGRDDDEDPWPRRLADERVLVEGDPQSGEHAERRDGAADPVRRGAPHEPPGNQPERHRDHQIGDPDRDADGNDVAALPPALHQRGATHREHRRDRRAEHRRGDVSDRSDTAFGKILAGGECQELALARGDGGAEQPDPQGQVLRKRCGSGNAGAEQPPDDDLGQRQQHDAAERERRQDVFSAGGERAHYLPFDFRKASRSCTA